MFLEKLQDLCASAYYAMKTPLFEIKEQYWVQNQSWYDAEFKIIDEALKKGPNPYQLSAVFPYGETPLRVIQEVALQMELTPSDRFVDLGCGRGRALFFINHVWGCKVHGVDLTSSFMAKGKEIALIYGKNKATFACHDILKTCFEEFTCVYLYGTTYSEEMIDMLEEKFEALPPKSRIVTVSSPLKRFFLKRSFEGRFPWGKGSLFLHEK
jgi:SAM-dependent methyltransferase